jgi:hypothetical protein
VLIVVLLQLVLNVEIKEAESRCQRNDGRFDSGSQLPVRNVMRAVFRNNGIALDVERVNPPSTFMFLQRRLFRLPPLNRRVFSSTPQRGLVYVRFGGSRGPLNQFPGSQGSSNNGPNRWDPRVKGLALAGVVGGVYYVSQLVSTFCMHNNNKPNVTP